MSNSAKIAKFRSLKSLAAKLRKDLRGVHGRRKTAKRKGTTPVNGNDFVLLFAHNGVGKTRLSVEFKDLGKKLVTSSRTTDTGDLRVTAGSELRAVEERQPDTLYFNAFTEDLFDWDNDLKEDKERLIKFKSQSQFFKDLEGMGIEDVIRPHLQRYADFNFAIDYTASEIRFFKDVLIKGKSKRLEDIKISRGEENIFIWCFFMAILQLAIEAKKGQPYDWVKYVYIDDPISSLDEHNTIVVASDLGALLKSEENDLKVVISTHHSLFFNIMFNELTGKRAADGKDNIKKKAYILHRTDGSQTYTL